ncbi:MAG: hypothetical protein J5857_07120 [Treponema sp.]|nr:hypothetical protein [Treponema sp.]
MKLNKKILIIAGSALFLALAVIITILCLNRRTPGVKIGFYDLEKTTEDIFVELIKDSYAENKDAPAISFVHLDQIDSSVDLMLMPMGKKQDDLIASINSGKKKNPSLPFSVMSETTSSIRQKSLKIDDKVISIPLLMDNVELNISNDAIAMTDTKQLQTWKDIETFATSSQQFFPYPIVFAGADYPTLLSVFTALTECYSGKDAYDEAVNSISRFFDERNGIYDSSEILELLETLAGTPESPLYAAASTLARWINSGLLTVNVFNMTKRDVEIYMENRYSSVVITTLSDHRNMSTQATNKYTSLPRAVGNGGNSVGFFPSSRPASQRYLTCPVISAVPLTKNKSSATVIKTLLSKDFQSKISFYTGLAPVDAQCQTPDILSDDVRFFVAATNAPLTPLNQAAFSDEKQIESFAIELTGYVKKMRK